MLSFKFRGRHDHGDRMVVGPLATYAINAYHHQWCEFQSRSVNPVIIVGERLHRLCKVCNPFE